MNLVFLVLGLVLLIVGAESLVRGASRLAARLGIAPLIIGLTVVAFGTSAPEMAVSVQSALDGQPGLALGNVVGSNIFNVLFILGLSALIVPLLVTRQLVRFDVPLMVAISVVVWLLALDGRISRLEGAALFLGLLIYVALLARQAWSSPERGAQAGPEPGRTLANIGYVVGGLALLLLGSRWLVSGAVELALAMGVSDLVVGLTLVAAGTSMPEVVTSVVASLRGERDIAVGNVVGSNIFNLLGVLGLAAVVAEEGMPVSDSALHFDLAVMVAVAFACLPIFFTGFRIERWEGALFLAYYVVYTVCLILAARDHPALTTLATAMLWFVLPLTALTLLLLTVLAWRKTRTVVVDARD